MFNFQLAIWNSSGQVSSSSETDQSSVLFDDNQSSDDDSKDVQMHNEEKI